MAVTTLSHEAEARGLGLAARTWWAEFWLRVLICLVILSVFVVANIKVLQFIQGMVEFDQKALSDMKLPDYQPIVQSEVLLALIGGTVAQIVTVLLGITRYVFPGK